MNHIKELDLRDLVGMTITHVEPISGSKKHTSHVLWLGPDVRLYGDDLAVYAPASDAEEAAIADAFTPPDPFSRKV